VKELAYLRPADAAEAVSIVAASPQARFLGGGTNLVDHLKLGIASPGLLVDISRLPLDTIEEVDDGTRLRIGANVRNSDLAAHPLIRSGFPGVARALLAGASGQIRNQATTGGNLLQRTRCVYFQDASTPCNKRQPGSGCSALEGYGRYNAILGAGPDCVAVHPSDLAIALAALDATVIVLGPDGERRLPFADLHRLPGHRPDQDTTLDHGELITGLELDIGALARSSTYRKVRDRASYAFALVSVCAALDRDEEGRVREVRIAWGGVAHRPWRAARAEAALRGEPLSEDAIRDSCSAELENATTTEQTAYKVPMVREATVHALMGLADREQS
jgi:xanthine dehydrogenase YagS FAD-binding subunit